VGLGFEVEGKDLVLASEGAPHAPFDALTGNTLEDAQSVENFERFLGVANATGRRAFHSDGVVFVEQYRLNPPRRQAAGHGQPGDPAPHNHHLVATHRALDKLGRWYEGVLWQLVAGPLGEFIAVGVGDLRKARALGSTGR